jgi:hypothetical protein
MSIGKCSKGQSEIDAYLVNLSWYRDCWGVTIRGGRVSELAMETA